MNDLRNECLLYNMGHGLPFPELQKVTIAEHWEKFGGSFLKGLAKALYVADIHNEKKIRENWKNEIEKHYDYLLKEENKKW